eukprot:g53090.t1
MTGYFLNAFARAANFCRNGLAPHFPVLSLHREKKPVLGAASAFEAPDSVLVRCYGDVRCHAVVFVADGGTFYSDRPLNFPLAFLQEHDPGRRHAHATDSGGRYFLHPVPDDALELEGDLLVRPTGLFLALTRTLDRRLNQRCDRFGWSLDTPFTAPDQRPATRARALVVLRERWRGLQRCYGWNATDDRLLALHQSGSCAGWLAQLCPGRVGGANQSAGENQSTAPWPGCPAVDAACAGTARALLPGREPLRSYEAARYTLAYYRALHTLVTNRGLAWYEAFRGAELADEDLRSTGPGEATYRAEVRRWFLAWDLEREAARDALLGAPLLRGAVRPAPAAAGRHGLAPAGAAVPGSVGPAGCLTSEDAAAESGRPASDHCGFFSAGGARFWPGEEELAAAVAQTDASLSGASSPWARFRRGTHPLASAEVEPYELLRYHAPRFVGGLAVPAVSGPGVSACYDLGWRGGGDGGATEYLHADPLPLCRPEVLGPRQQCSRLAPDRAAPWFGYLAWRHWVLLEAFTHGEDRLGPGQPFCDRLDLPLWRTEPVRARRLARLRRVPVPAARGPRLRLGRRGARRRARRRRLVDGLGRARRARGRPEPRHGQDPLRLEPTRPNTEAVNLVYSADGRARVPRSLREDACGVDVRQTYSDALGADTACNHPRGELKDCIMRDSGVLFDWWTRRGGFSMAVPTNPQAKEGARCSNAIDGARCTGKLELDHFGSKMLRCSSCGSDSSKVAQPP